MRNSLPSIAKRAYTLATFRSSIHSFYFLFARFKFLIYFRFFPVALVILLVKGFLADSIIVISLSLESRVYETCFVFRWRIPCKAARNEWLPSLNIFNDNGNNSGL